MSAASNELESRLGYFVLRTGMPAKPSELWLGLYTGYNIPSETTGEGFEVSRTFFGNDTGYRRVLCGPGDAWWAENPTTPGQFYNAQIIQFPTAIYSWGGITGWALHPSDEGEGHWLSGFLTTPLVVNSGDPAPAFEAGSLIINFF